LDSIDVPQDEEIGTTSTTPNTQTPLEPIQLDSLSKYKESESKEATTNETSQSTEEDNTNSESEVEVQDHLGTQKLHYSLRITRGCNFSQHLGRVNDGHDFVFMQI